MANSVTRNSLIAEAGRRGWKVEFIGHQNFFCKITDNNGHSELFRGSQPLRNAANGMIIAAHKELTMEYAQYLGYAVPPYMVTADPTPTSEMLSFLNQYSAVVVKPTDGLRSIGVTVDIQDQARLKEALAAAHAHSRSGQVMIQRQLTGQLYRLTLINGNLVAAGWRRAPVVTGNGTSTIEQLIEVLNQDPRRGTGNDSPLKTVKLADVQDWLGPAGLKRVPANGEEVKVIGLDSVSAGGESIDVTDRVHQDWHRVTTHIIRDVGLFICGYDVICDDIAAPIKDNYLPLLEINSEPGFKLHQYPAVGQPIDLAPLLFDQLFDVAKIP